MYWMIKQGGSLSILKFLALLISVFYEISLFENLTLEIRVELLVFMIILCFFVLRMAFARLIVFWMI